jgi:hypothetical protein
MLHHRERKPTRLHDLDYSMPGAYRLHPGTWKNDDFRRVGQLPVRAKVEKFENLSNIIGAFKTTAATRVNKLRGMIGIPVWQRSFHDRIIRDNRELEYIQKYIQNNPINWVEDRIIPTIPDSVYRSHLWMGIGMKYLIDIRRRQQLFPTGLTLQKR